MAQRPAPHRDTNSLAPFGRAREVELFLHETQLTRAQPLAEYSIFSPAGLAICVTLIIRVAQNTNRCKDEKRRGNQAATQSTPEQSANHERAKSVIQPAGTLYRFEARVP
jgi:hypothetical protein